MPDVGIELGAACMPSEHASDRATAPGTTDFENRLNHQVNIILCTFLDFDLPVHILLSNVSPFCNRKFLSILHTSGFGVKILISNDTTFVRVFLFSKMLQKTISDDHKSLKHSMQCDQ